MKSTIQYDTDKNVFIRGESEYKTLRNRDMMLNRELTKCFLTSGPEVLDDTGSQSCNLGVGTLLFAVSMHIVCSLP